jgi:hypothetical protein
MMPTAAEIREALPFMRPAERVEFEAIVTSLQGVGAADVLNGTFPEQRAFILDESPLKSAFCTRRGAKSFSFGLECIHDSKDWPNANYLFLGLVREEAKRIFWKDVLKKIDRQYALRIRFNETSLTATMRNGATIYIGAADAHEDEMRKLLGQKYRKIAIDEAQDWHIDLEELVFHTLKPACADLHGSIELLGTPGKVNRGLFHDITPSSVQAGIAGEKSEGSAGWSVHCWDTHSNTSVMDAAACKVPDCGHTMREHWSQEIAQLVAMKPGIEQTPWFRRNYKGEKVIEDEALVYRYQAGRNDFNGNLPNIDGPGFWHYVLGIDLGYEDPSAFILWAFHDSDPNLYGLEAFKKSGMDITAAALHAKSYRRGRTLEAMVIDGSNKQAVVEMSNRHELHELVAADKTGKPDFIELMNADYIMGRIKLGPKCAALKAEYSQLIWNDKKVNGIVKKREEHPACENHAADGGLYGWRYSYQYLSKIPSKKPAKGSEEWAKQEQQAMFEKAARDVQRIKKGHGDDFGGDMDDWGGGMELGGGFG